MIANRKRSHPYSLWDGSFFALWIKRKAELGFGWKFEFGYRRQLIERQHIGSHSDQLLL